ncbi:MAG: hypothetical protein ACLPXZ_04310 [Mycobacterium sp.]
MGAAPGEPPIPSAPMVLLAAERSFDPSRRVALRYLGYRQQQPELGVDDLDITHARSGGLDMAGGTSRV